MVINRIICSTSFLGLLLLLFSHLVMSDSVTPWTQAFLSLTISQSLLKLMAIESVMPSNHLILLVPFSCLQSFPGSGYFLLSWQLYLKLWIMNEKKSCLPKENQDKMPENGRKLAQASLKKKCRDIVLKGNNRKAPPLQVHYL